MKETTYYYIILLVGIIFSSISYIGSTYYFKYGEKNNISFNKILFISIFFGVISYIIKIPVYYYYGKYWSALYIHILFYFVSFIVILLYSYFILNEKIETHTYIIIVIIFILLIINDLYKKID